MGATSGPLTSFGSRLGSSDPSNSHVSLWDKTAAGHKAQDDGVPSSKRHPPPGPERSVALVRVRSSQGESSQAATERLATATERHRAQDISSCIVAPCLMKRVAPSLRQACQRRCLNFV